MQPEEYRDRAVAQIQALLAEQRAVIWAEVEARLADRPYGPNRWHIDPHHLTTAKRLMMDDGLLLSSVDPTRGGHLVETYYLAGTPQMHVESAAARKRLLHARFLGWAKGTRRHPKGLIGGAGELVVANAMERAATAGYRPGRASRR